MPQSFRSKRAISLLCTAVVLGMGTLVLRGETQYAQLTDGTPYLLLDDATATVSNGVGLDRKTPARKVSGMGMRGSYTALVQGQSLVWKNTTTLPTGMYDVFATNPLLPQQAEYANLAAFVVNDEGKSTNVPNPIPLNNDGVRTESFEGQTWKHIGKIYIEEKTMLYSLILSTVESSKGLETPVDGILLRRIDITDTKTFSYNGAFADHRGKFAQAELHDGGRTLTPGVYTISASWAAVNDLSSADKKNTQSTARSPYVQFDVFGTASGASDRSFQFTRALDLRTASTGKKIENLLWQELGTVTIPANIKNIKLKWSVANVPGSTVAAGTVSVFPVMLHASALHGAADSSSTSASTTSAIASSASSESEESEESSSSATTTSISVSSTTTSTSTPVLNISSPTSNSNATSQASTGPLDLTPGSAVLDNTSANFYMRGFATEAGGYRNSFHGAAPAQSVQSDIGGAYAGWRMPTIEHGEYDAYLTWPTVAGGSPAAPITISTVVPSNGSYLKISKTVVVNQSRAPMGPTVANNTWQKIARITIDEFSGHNSVEFRVNDKTPGNRVIVDALLLRKIPR